MDYCQRLDESGVYGMVLGWIGSLKHFRVKKMKRFSYNCVQIDYLILSLTGLVLALGAFYMG